MVHAGIADLVSSVQIIFVASVIVLTTVRTACPSYVLSAIFNNAANVIKSFV